MRKKRRVKSTKAKLEAFKKRREMDLERFGEDVNKDDLCTKTFFLDYESFQRKREQ